MIYLTILYKIKAAMNEVRNTASNGIEKETTSKKYDNRI